MAQNPPKAIGIILTGILLAGFILFTVYSFTQEIKRANLPVYGQVSNYTLINQEGEVFELKQLAGKVWVADFIFTTCSDICPMMTKNMAKLNRTFEMVEDVALVSITVNPEQDTAEVLKSYADKHKLKKTQWHFLTASRDIVQEMAVNDFKLGSIEEPIFHSSHFVLVDKHGFIRGFYDGLDETRLNALFKDAATLIKQKK